MTNRRQTDGHYLFKDIKAGEEKEGQDNGDGGERAGGGRRRRDSACVGERGGEKGQREPEAEHDGLRPRGAI